MFKVIGVDQKVYGPATADQLRQWLREGRLHPASLVQTEGTADWRALWTFPEFVPPPMMTLPPAQAPEASNGMATAGLIFGIASNVCCCFGFVFAILGLIFSLVALHRLEGRPQSGSRGIAWAGLILSIVGLTWHCFLPLLLGFPGGWWLHHRHWRYL